MKKLKMACSLLWFGSMYDMPVLWRYTTSFVRGTTPNPLHVYSQSELTQLLLQGKSMIRLGDGEAMLMTGRDIHYQTKSLKLKNDLRRIIDNYPTSPYIVAIPVEALTGTDAYLQQNNRFRIWRLFRCFAAVRLNLSLHYADAHSFYRQEYLQALLPELLKGKHVCCVSKTSNLDSILKSYLETYADTVTFITSPDRDSYEVLPSLSEDIRVAVKQSDIPSIVLLSAGPASKVLSYQLSQDMIQCIDMGHGLEIVGRDNDYSNKI